MFCHVTRTWRGRPLMSAAHPVAGIAAPVTAGGLKCTAVRDNNAYPDGIQISDARMKYLEDRVIERDPFHGEWNYAILPSPPNAPDPGPAPQPPGRIPRDVLNHAALTGMDPQDLTAPPAPLEVAFAAPPAHHPHPRRRRPPPTPAPPSAAPPRHRPSSPPRQPTSCNTPQRPAAPSPSRKTGTPCRHTSNHASEDPRHARNRQLKNRRCLCAENAPNK